MPIKNFSVGQPPGSTDINRYFQQRAHVIKAADESVTSSTTAQNDDHLFLSVAANTDYWVELFLRYDADSAADLRLGWSVPSGATMEWTSNGLSNAATGTADQLWRRRRDATMEEALGGVGSGTDLIALPEGLLRIGGTGGTLRVKWAQISSSATATRVFQRSMLMISRMVP